MSRTVPISHAESVEVESAPAIVAENQPSLYINPICMQMDKLILKAATPEDVLTILVTHRGALFVQNLVTALESLADMSTRSVPFSVSQKMKFPDQYEEVQKDKLLTDARYTLLIRDLIDYSSKLDIQSIHLIMHALQSLNHCHYKLFGSLLRRLYSMDIPESEISAAISIGSSLEWGGFGRAETFFNRLGDILIPHLSTLSTLDFVNASVMYSKLPKLYPELLDRFSIESICRSKNMSSRHLGYVSLSLSSYGGEIVPSVREAMVTIADELSDRPDVEIRDFVRVAVSLRRTNVGHTKLLEKSLKFFCAELDFLQSQRERMDPSIATISDLAQLVDACAHFGVGDASTLSKIILPHIENFVDLVTEESSVRILHAVARFPAGITSKNIPIVNLLIRKIGATASTAWEKDKLKLMFIWFAKCMHFPLAVDSEIRKFIIDKCLVHYLIARRGYMVPFPEDSKILWDMVVDAGLAAEKTAEFNAWIPNSPFHADILIPEHRLAVLVLSQFDALNPTQPVGTDAIKCDLIKSLGWELFAIDRKQIRVDQNLPEILADIRGKLGSS